MASGTGTFARTPLYCSPRWHAIVGIEDGGDVEQPSLWFGASTRTTCPTLSSALDDHLQARTDQLACEARVVATTAPTAGRSVGGWRCAGTGRRTGSPGSLTDISERREAEERRLHEALHDPLTGLANRALFLERLGQALRPSLYGRPQLPGRAVPGHRPLQGGQREPRACARR